MKKVIFILLLLLSTSAPAKTPAIDAFASVILARPIMPSAAKFRSALETKLDKTVKVDKMEVDDKVILLRLAGGTVMIGRVDNPIPNQELESNCKFAWDWKAACEVVAGHQAHLIVSVMGTKLDRIDSALLLTQIIAALMQDANSLASYWGVNLQSREVFLARAASASRERLPVTLWINYRLSKDPLNGWTLSTRGMREFNLMEIECKDAQTDGLGLFTLIAGMTRYLIEKGPVIMDDETIGDSPKLNIRVQHAPSYWNAGQTVYRVVYP